MTPHEQAERDALRAIITAMRQDIINQSEGLVRRQGALDQAHATVTAQAEQIEQLNRHAKVDAIAFNSMNHTAVDAELERDRLRADAARLRDALGVIVASMRREASEWDGLHPINRRTSRRLQAFADQLAVQEARATLEETSK